VEPIRVVVRRGSVVEAVHRVHAVAVRDGELIAGAGEAGLVTHLRSSAKPIQALLLARARADLGPEELAIACGSHRAEPAQIEAVRKLLAAAPAGEDELECGSEEGRPPGAIFHNCSGKHAGFLAVSRARGWDSCGYRLASHPLQRELVREVAAAAGMAEAEMATAIDGCGVLTFALTLERSAAAFARLPGLDGGAAIVEAMCSRPDLVGGSGSNDTTLMRALPGWAAKGGAEGLFCAASPDGTGIALKCEDGAQRPILPALVSFLARLGLRVDGFERVPLLNVHGEEVGEVACP
jgi:L-asparaginase II